MRVETVRIKMKLDKAAFDRHEGHVRTLIPNFSMPVVEGDELKVDYKFNIEYFGNVAHTLAAVKVLCSDPDVVTEADCEMLVEGRILCYAALRELDAVIGIIKTRTSKRTWREWWRGK